MVTGYLLGWRPSGPRGPLRNAFYRGIVDGTCLVVALPPSAHERVSALDRRVADLDLEFVDAAVVTLAELHAVPRIATADRPDFEPVARDLGLELVP